MNVRLMIERTKTNSSGECRVYIEISVHKNGEKKKTVRIPSNIKVNANHWSAKSQSIIRGKTKDYYKLNQSLSEQKNNVYEIISDLQKKGLFELSEIKRKYLEKSTPVTYSFFDQYDDFLKMREKSMTYNGVKDYKTLKTHLLGFEKYRKNKIILSNINSTFFENFQEYLGSLKLKKTTKEKNGKEENEDIILLADSSIIKNLQTLRGYLNYQRDKGNPVDNTYTNFKLKSKPNPPLITLEPDEYKLLLKEVSNERLEKVRKLFILQCSTGLRYSDAIKIRKSHVRNDTIFINATKTRQKLQIPLNINSKKILESCNYNTSELAISNQKYNDYIKELCENVGINQEIMKIMYRGNKEVQKSLKKHEIMSSHHGRRFFITQNLINGVRPEVIMSMTGHVDFRSFKKYIAITDKTRATAMEIWSKTFN